MSKRKRRGRSIHKRTQKEKLPDPIEVPLPEGGGFEPGARSYRMGRCSIIVGRIPAGPNINFPGWHISISHPSRYPTWDEVASARYKLVPRNVMMGMLLPGPQEYLNLDENCFHIHELRPIRSRQITDPTGCILGIQHE